MAVTQSDEQSQINGASAHPYRDALVAKAYRLSPFGNICV